MQRILPLIAVTLALAWPAQADDGADRRRAALLLLESEVNDATIRQLSAEPVHALMRASHAERPGLGPQDMMVLSALYHEEMYAAARAALGARATALAARYTLDELEALRRFRASDVGRAALAEAEGPFSGLAPSVSAEMERRMDQVLERHIPRD